MRLVTPSLKRRHLVRRDTYAPGVVVSRPSRTTDDVGGMLRAARERRGLSVDELARVTKIRVAILRAIETNHREALPENIFLRGFLRAYAREVGLDSETTSARYLDQFEPIVTDAGTEGTASATRERQPVGDTSYDDAPLTVRDQWIVIGLVVAISFAGFTLIRWRTSPATSSGGPGFRGSELARPSPTVPAVTRAEPNAVARDSRGGPTSVSAIQLELAADGPCWVSATVDGKRVAYRLMQRGEQASLNFHTDAVLRIGDPTALSLTINGAAGRPLGSEGEAVTVRITPENYREFLRR